MEIDLLSVANFAGQQPHDQFAWLREHDPVHRHPEPHGPGFWAVTRRRAASRRSGEATSRLSVEPHHRDRGCSSRLDPGSGGPRDDSGGRSAGAHADATTGQSRVHATSGRPPCGPGSTSWRRRRRSWTR
ncbi:MAG: hypothetical protein U5R31_17670 [Acidimicrobiia bacterium]|nr:hypothetical protein [Acidimicrobiia bacterium]